MKNNFISSSIPLDATEVLEAISYRQSLSWNNGRIDDYYSPKILDDLFLIINSGIPEEDFFYKGNLYRIHTPYGGLVSQINENREFINGKISSDGSCRILQYTDYSGILVSFSKSYDFTNHLVYYKICPSQRSILIHESAFSVYGIDVNTLQKRFGVTTRYAGEQEVLFPIDKKYLIKEYFCTPNQFKYYLRNHR